MAEVPSPREVRTYRAWGAARRITEGVRDPAFRELLQRIDGGPMHHCSPPVLLPEGAEAFRTMISAIDAAQDEVLLETYILRDDTLGVSVQQTLVRAAARNPLMKRRASWMPSTYIRIDVVSSSYSR